MKVLGISTSRRAWGNTDLLVAAALKGAKAEGAEVRLLRVADLELKPCNGCMRCVFQGRDCVIPDRMSELYEALRWAEGYVFGAPTYVLLPNSVQKTIQDRLIQLSRAGELSGRPGMAVVTAGVAEWEGFALPLISMSLQFLGLTVVDRFVGRGQGPGEILDDKAALVRAERGGRAIARGEKAYLGEPGVCPLCELDLVTSKDGREFFCEVCSVKGTLENGRLKPNSGSLSRTSREMVAHHFNERVLPSGPRFKEKVKDYLARIAEFKNDAGF